MTIESPRRARWATWVAAAAIAGACAGAQAATMSGVYAAGSIRNVFRICMTCNSEFELLFADEDGGLGSTGPAIVDGYEAKGYPQGFGSVYARALVVGPTATPYLGAYAAAKPGIGPWPGYSGDGAYLFSANASARAAQHYTFLGSVAETYRMTFKLNGSAAGYSSSADIANDRLITANGGLALYDADTTDGSELPYGWLMDIEQLSFSAASASNFDDSRTVSITLEPGDSFYAVAWLGATVGVGAAGAADVSHTLSIAFTAGDVTLLQPDLQPQAQPMPEPGTATLALLGLAAMRWSRRPQRTA
ncbi:hypothetical protein MOJ79_03255 [Calidifontimicrobium sp. SYSU G02091]|uniref:hypothetical protein n=1 Tax=Calidifontimicrobium sp. SYSU G02091 TaxID=2926421 RepID=UPI001F52EF8C|nr:hypothetical protein [Calidifontimicrobium sp. SYSU G02091]MCI1190855.1 hypothetical protein [Calidifontimicrobium sp. SYSU G02091]